MSINDVILFVSSTSKACIPVVQFTNQNSLPVKLVRLDTIEDRNLAISGNKYFQIHTVPSLLVIYSHGDVRLFIGIDKILSWFQQILALNSRESETPTLEEEKTILISEESPKRKKHKKPKEKNKKKYKKGLYDGQKKNKKPPPVDFENEEENSSEIEYIEREEDVHHGRKRSNRPPPPPTSGLMIGQQSLGKRKSQMSSLFDEAKRMEKERQETLGYKESDLPIYT